MELFEYANEQMLNNTLLGVRQKFPLLDSTLDSLQIVATDEVPTCCTDNEKVLCNPKFMESLTYDQRVFALSHEILHVAFDHILRSKDKDMYDWNVATDAVINKILKDNGLTMIDGVIDMDEAQGKSAEEMYEIIHNQDKNKEDSQEQDNNSISNNSANSNDTNKQEQSSQSNSNSNSNKEQSNPADKQEQSSQDNSENNNQNNEQNQSNQNNSGKDDSQNQQNQDNSGEDKPNQSGQDNSSEDSSSQSNSQSNNSKDGKQESADNNKQNTDSQQNANNNSQSADDNKSANDNENDNSQKEDHNNVNSDKKPDINNHNMWEEAVKKYELDQELNKKRLEEKRARDAKQSEITENSGKDKIQEESKSDLEKKFEQKNQEKKEEIGKELIKKLKEHLGSKGAGKGASSEGKYTLGEVGKADKIFSWKTILKRYIDNDTEMYNYRRADEDNYYQARIEDIEQYDKPGVEVMLDTSYSVSDSLIREFLRQLKHLIKDTKLRVGCFSYSAYDFVEIKKVSDIDNFEIKGRGGTNFDCAAKAFTWDGRDSENINRIIFTDGEDDFTLTDKKYKKLIWVIYDNPDFKTDYGRVIYVNSKDIMQKKSQGLEM